MQLQSFAQKTARFETAEVFLRKVFPPSEIKMFYCRVPVVHVLTLWQNVGVSSKTQYREAQIRLWHECSTGDACLSLVGTGWMLEDRASESWNHQRTLMLKKRKWGSCKWSKGWRCAWGDGRKEPSIFTDSSTVLCVKSSLPLCLLSVWTCRVLWCNVVVERVAWRTRIRAALKVNMT